MQALHECYQIVKLILKNLRYNNRRKAAAALQRTTQAIRNAAINSPFDIGLSSDSSMSENGILF